LLVKDLLNIVVEPVAFSKHFAELDRRRRAEIGARSGRR
jgi:hypothetical protein